MFERFWPLIRSMVWEFWEITEPFIEDSAIQNNIPIELYSYSKFGMEYFSVRDFQKRDPFSNPQQFEKMFAQFELHDWIFPIHDNRYQVSDKARDAVRKVIQAGDEQLSVFDRMTEDELRKIVITLKKIVTANLEAPEPPEKWACITHFRASHDQSPLVVQIRELLMDLYAYRDDSHLAAAHSYFGQAGIVWIVLGAIWKGTAVSAKQMDDVMSYRGYEEDDYEVAIQAAVEIGWVEPADKMDTYRPTQRGIEIRERVEKMSDEYFYHSWSALSGEELYGLYLALTKLRDQLVAYKDSLAIAGRL